MKEKIIILLTVFLSAAGSISGQEAEISGHMQLPETWKRKAYVCRILDFGLMYQASNALLVAEANIEPNGSFKIRFPATPNETLYRIQFVHNDDPASTIIIGSQDENHVFFVARDSDAIHLGQSDEKLIDQAQVEGGTTNEELKALLKLVGQDTLPRDSIKVMLIRMAREAHSDLVALLAVHSMFGLSEAQREEVSALLSKRNRDNPYGKRIFEEFRPSHLRLYLILSILLLLCILIPLAVWGYRDWTSKKTLQLLSPRELDIARLILEGKTNKDMAAILNIELSTVKTHVNNLYAKLKVTERKGLVRYERRLKRT